MRATAATVEPEIAADLRKDVFYLCEVEIETVRRAAEVRDLPFDPTKRSYTSEELRPYGLVREGYNKLELRERGIRPQPVSSLDPEVEALQSALPLQTPFATGIKKFELPIDMFPMRVAKTIFPPGSVVEPHVHPPHNQTDPGGSLRVVVKGRLFYEGREYAAGDWFFVPNGTPYQFTSDPNEETIVMYTYNFFGAEKGNRFSHPHALK
ncbi:MAG TPA: cupin domain-containing protein [Thermoanaerobaculia bacterium]|nr:cupin domain-containing protein [Thermoanaerobaculia bacterium]